MQQITRSHVIAFVAANALIKALGIEPIMERMRALAGVRPLIGAGA